MKKARDDESKAGSLTSVDSGRRDEVVQLYKLQMPEDLFQFWEFCKELNPDDPCSMFCHNLVIHNIASGGKNGKLKHLY